MEETERNFDNDPLKFASLMAHQLQSPLNAVITALQTVLGEYTGPLLPQQRNALERGLARCEQAITSVRRMLAIMKAEAEKETLATPASLANALRQVHSQYLSEATRHQITFTVESENFARQVRMSEATLVEVLSALVSNALKYTPDHGKVVISVGSGEESGYVRVRVADSGVGIPEKDFQRVFEPFYRTPAARESAQPGVGLGLTFVKSMVTACGGNVRAQKSTLGGAEFVLDLPLAKETAETETPARPAFKVVVVGGVTAGPKAAAKIIRMMPDADVTIVDRGSVLSYAGCGLPYYIAGLVRDQRQLISSPAGVVRDLVFFRSVKNVHVVNRTEVVEIDRAAKRVRMRDCISGRESWLPYDKLLLATGASANVPDNLRVGLENVFTLHGVRDAEGIRAALAENRARDVVIIGGGLLGIEITQAFVSKGARVTILEKRDHILPILDGDMAVLVECYLESRGVKILTQTNATGLRGRDGRVCEVLTDKGGYPADMVILALGVHPNVQLAREAGLEIGETGAIAVDERLQTSDPDIYAAGDCAETRHILTGRPFYFPLGSTASKQGHVAAVNICGGNDTFPGVLGSCICNVFEYNVGRTGLGENEAVAQGYEVVTVYAPGPDKEHFMPNAELLLLKLIVDRNSRQLLGVQATGKGAADKRVDVASLAIRARMTVDDLATLDLCYAPQYSPAMDNLITAANVARNKLDGHMTGIRPAEVYRMLKERADFVFLDVRTPEEYEHMRLPHSTLIPLGALRGRVAELPADKLIVTFCDISLRAYEAALVLRNAGFRDVRVMDGGIAMWPFEKLE